MPRQPLWITGLGHKRRREGLEVAYFLHYETLQKQTSQFDQLHEYGRYEIVFDADMSL